ncbi:MAG TPA: nucleotide sugar dehydrogenase [Bacillales bacterium]|nr:nucleotide sugar dehydrogenase [Bacillales bacterium]
MSQKITVIGLGYIGLPTAVMFASHGFRVHGVDINEETVASLRNREIHIEEPGLEERLAKVMDEGRFTVGTEPEEADAFIIAVPSPIYPDKSADLSYVQTASESIASYVRKENLVILESTVPPKTIETVVIPALASTGLEIGEELFVAHSPERVLPGKLFQELVYNDRILGGVNEESSRRALELYRAFVQADIRITDATTAEMVKVVENTYRDVNIAFANELAKISDQLDVNVWEVIELANCHPRVNVHKPGPGVGGHCVAVDPWFLAHYSPDQPGVIETSRKTNDSMPAYTVERALEIMKQQQIAHPKIAVLGLAFKGNINDTRESPSLRVIEELQKKGIEFSVYDPHVTENLYLNQSQDLIEAISHTDLLMVLTEHSEFRVLNPDMMKQYMRSPFIMDTKGFMPFEQWEKSGFDTYTLGDSKHQKNDQIIRAGYAE